MTRRVCTVGFRAPSGIFHSVDVLAETLMEAVGLGLARLKRDGWVEGLGPETRVEISVREPSTNHVVSVRQFHRWLNATSNSGAPW